MGRKSTKTANTSITSPKYFALSDIKLIQRCLLFAGPSFFANTALFPEPKSWPLQHAPEGAIIHYASVNKAFQEAMIDFNTLGMMIRNSYDTPSLKPKNKRYICEVKRIRNYLTFAVKSDSWRLFEELLRLNVIHKFFSRDHISRALLLAAGSKSAAAMFLTFFSVKNITNVPLSGPIESENDFAHQIWNIVLGRNDKDAIKVLFKNGIKMNETIDLSRDGNFFRVLRFMTALKEGNLQHDVPNHQLFNSLDTHPKFKEPFLTKKEAEKLDSDLSALTSSITNTAKLGLTIVAASLDDLVQQESPLQQECTKWQWPLAKVSIGALHLKHLAPVKAMKAQNSPFACIFLIGDVHVNSDVRKQASDDQIPVFCYKTLDQITAFIERAQKANRNFFRPLLTFPVSLRNIRIVSRDRADDTLTIEATCDDGAFLRRGSFLVAVKHIRNDKIQITSEVKLVQGQVAEVKLIDETKNVFEVVFEEKRFYSENSNGGVCPYSDLEYDIEGKDEVLVCDQFGENALLVDKYFNFDAYLSKSQRDLMPLMLKLAEIPSVKFRPIYVPRPVVISFSSRK